MVKITQEKIYQKYCQLVNNTVIPTGLSKDKTLLLKKPCAIYLGRKIKDTDELILRNIAYKQRIPVYKMAIGDTSKEYRLNAIRQKNTAKQLLLP